MCAQARFFGRAAFALFLLVAPGCSHEHATKDDCRAILDHVVEIELGERGFKDPALATRKRDELATLLAPELRRCLGRPLPHGAMSCVKAAKTVEIISHRCLR